MELYCRRSSHRALPTGLCLHSHTVQALLPKKVKKALVAEVYAFVSKKVKALLRARPGTSEAMLDEAGYFVDVRPEGFPEFPQIRREEFPRFL